MSNPERPTWAVASMVDEPLPLVAAFVAHYLALGAAGIWLLLDRPRPEVVAALALVPQVHVKRGDDDYWTVFRARRPGPITLRQRHFADMVYAEAGVDWLFHVDCDEFLQADRPVADILAAAPPDKAVVRFPTMERVRSGGDLAAAASIFEGTFKRPQALTEDQRQVIWGDVAPLFASTGFLGHNVGKSMTRTGLPLRQTAHFPFPVGLAGGLEERMAWLGQNEVVTEPALLHFDGLTPLHWVLKLIGRLSADAGKLDNPPPVTASARKTRSQQIRDLHGMIGDGAALMALAGRALTLDARQRDLFGGEAAFARISLTLEHAARHRFPALDLDFSIAAFDADLRRHRRELIVLAGLPV